MAIVLFDSDRGPAYVQLTGVTLNGKTEVRVCDRVSKFDKGGYNLLPRVSFIGASSLQRGKDGMLTLTVNGSTMCAVPDNLKFGKNSEFTPPEAAEQAILQSATTPASPAGLPEFKRGVQLVFVTAPDFELAEFLRAQRANTVKDWQDFIARYPASHRVSDAKTGIAEIHQRAGEGAFAQYQRSGVNSPPDTTTLRQASLEAQAAIQAVAGYEPAIRLTGAVARELDHLLEADHRRLQAFQKALQNHNSGYSQLAAAQVHVEQVLAIRTDYAPGIELRREIAAESGKIEAALLNAESLEKSARYDDAVGALGSYIAIASEVPRVDAIIEAAYRDHFNRGQQLAAIRKWEPAVAEFRAATAVRPDGKEAELAFKNATAQLSAERDQEQAKLALNQSNDHVAKSEYVEAYEVLANLPDRPRALVMSQLSELKSNYVSAAMRRAQKIQDAHIPIRGWTDADAVHEAYTLLSRISGLTSDPAVALKRDFLSNKVSTYYADQANRCLLKPAGSGIGVGWLYLLEAQRYGVTNRENVKDQMARYALLYQRRAKLSVGIALRDQTSRSNGPGFADQLTDAIAHGLESSGVGVVVVRKTADAADALQPNFMVVGEVLDHRVIKTEAFESPQSKYRAGTYETKNPAWLEAKSDYESARQQLATAQNALADAQSQHKKKEVVAAANDAVQLAQKNADKSKHKFEITDENRVEVIIEPYHYTKKITDLSASVDLAFRITDRSGNVICDPVEIHKTNHKSIIVLQDVKPEDTENITNQSVEPDQAQFLTDLEIETRDALVNAIREKASELPEKLLAQARHQAQRGDLDAAAEVYVMYLNTTSGAAPARDEAVEFLRQQIHAVFPNSPNL